MILLPNYNYIYIYDKSFKFAEISPGKLIENCKQSSGWRLLSRVSFTRRKHVTCALLSKVFFFAKKTF